MKAPRRLRKTWWTKIEAIVWIATRDRRRVDDQGPSRALPEGVKPRTPGLLAAINSAIPTTYVKRGAAPLEIGEPFFDATLAFEEAQKAGRIVEGPKGFRREGIEAIWPPGASGRRSVDTLDPGLIERLISKLLNKNRDDYAETHGGRGAYALCRVRVLEEIGVTGLKNNKHSIDMLVDTALSYAEQKCEGPCFGEEIRPTERQIANLRSWRQKGRPPRKFGI